MSMSHKTHTIHVATPTEDMPQASPLADLLRRFLFDVKTQRLIVFLLALSMIYAAVRYARQRNVAAQNALLAVEATITPTPAPKAATKAPIYLDKTYVCTLPTMTAYLSEGKAALSYAASGSQTKSATAAAFPKKDAHIVFDGDCVYSWSETGTAAGIKRCGLSSYLQTYSSVAAYTGGADMNGLVSVLQSSHVINDQDAAQAQTLLRACRAVVKVDEKEFMVPKSVRFQTLKE